MKGRGAEMRILSKRDPVEVDLPIRRSRLRGHAGWLALVINCILLTQCLSATSTKPPQSGGNSESDSVIDLKAEESAIYDLVIEARHRRYAESGSDLIVIANRTSAYTLSPKSLDETLRWVSDHTPGGIGREVVENTEKQNDQTYELGDLFRLSVP